MYCATDCGACSARGGCTFYGVAAAAGDDLEVSRHEVADLVGKKVSELASKYVMWHTWSLVMWSAGKWQLAIH